MTFFFLVVGLEAKRELDTGELRERQRLAIPVVAALGGMALPVAIYLAFNAGGGGAHGWGAAMSTDTALALGVLSLLAPRGTRLRLRMLTLAVVDDLVALVVIAIVYTSDLSLLPLGLALGFFGILLALRYAPVAWRRQAAVLLGVALWIALFESGIDPVVAGLAIGLVTSAYPPARVRPRAGDRADPLVSRATNARARPLSAAGRCLCDFGERATSVRASSVDELPDRAHLRAGERRRPHRWTAPRRRGHLAGHARHRVRLRAWASHSGSWVPPGWHRGRGSRACAAD